MNAQCTEGERIMLKVLVVDDEAPIRQWMAYCVDHFTGFTVSGIAASGRQGIEMYRRELPDIVVSDIEMPGIDGLEMLNQMSRIHPAYMIVLTSHEDFSYARRALTQGAAEYILKTEITREAFEAVLNKGAKVIREKRASGSAGLERSAQRLFQQMAAKGERMEITGELLRRHGISLKDRSLLTVDIWNENGAEMPGLGRIAAELPFLENLCMVPLDHEHLLIAANISREGSTYMAAEWFRGKIRPPFVAGISDMVTGLEELPGAVRQAQARFRLHFYHPDRRVFWREPTGSLVPRQTQMLRVSFSKELFARRYDKAAAVKDQVLREIMEDCPTDLEAVKDLCDFFASTLLHLTMEREERLEQIRRQIEESRTMAVLKEILDQVFAPFEHEAVQPKSYSEPVRKAVSFIKAHYAEQITLGQVAEQVSFNPEYFSRLFTRETGLHFVAYLNNLRMRRAVELLERTDKKIYEIAEEVGFSNVSYFSTVFKKNFGQNPNVYQRNARNIPEHADPQ